MDIQISINTDNLEKVKAAFLAFPDKVGPFLRDASQTAAFAVERESKKLSPVDTGRMRASIATSLGILSRGIQSIVSTNVSYAIYVHEGTRFMPGRPFMKQGGDAAAHDIEQAFDSNISKALELLNG